MIFLEKPGNATRNFELLKLCENNFVIQNIILCMFNIIDKLYKGAKYVLKFKSIVSI